MRNFTLLTCTAIVGIFLSASFIAPNTKPQPALSATTIVQTQHLEGAWRLSGQADGTTTIRLVQDGYFTVAVYDQKGKKFIGTYGGTYTITGNKLTEQYEFSTFDATQVGNTAIGTSTVKNGNWQTTGLGQAKGKQTWERINEQESASPLAGTWRITGREQEGKMNTMKPGPRKTLKVLSGSRFQWIAFNTETGEFSGTGGGTYTAQDGIYTETIEFFSRDSSRVGMQLSFNFELTNGKWHHTGQSSTGKKVNEIWQRITAN